MSQNEVYHEYTFEDFERMIDDAVNVILNSKTLALEVRRFENDLATLEGILIEAINALRSRLRYPEELVTIAENIEWFLEDKRYLGDSDKFHDVVFTGMWYAWGLLYEIEENVPTFNDDVLEGLIGKDGYNDFLDKWFLKLSNAEGPLWKMQRIMEDVFYDLNRVAKELREFSRRDSWTLQEQEDIADWLEALLGMIDDARTYLPEFEDRAKNAAIDALEYLLDLIWKALLP